MKPKHIMAFDLSLTSTGMCLLNTETKEVIFDEVNTSPKQTLIQRCTDLFEGIEEFYSDYEFLNPFIAVEIPKGSQSSKASMAAGACTACMVCTKLLKRSHFVYGPRSIKELVGQPHIKGYDRKKLNIQAADKLYPDAPFNRAKDGSIRYKENHKADSLLIAHLAYLDS